MGKNEYARVPEWTLSDRLRKAREESGLTQAELAEQMGVTVATVSRAERGAGVSHRTLRQWAWITDVSLDWINAGSTCACTTCAPGEAA